VPVTLELLLLMILFFSLAIAAMLLPGPVLLSSALRLFRADTPTCILVRQWHAGYDLKQLILPDTADTCGHAGE
jgi:hypothetical protein